VIRQTDYFQVVAQQNVVRQMDCYQHVVLDGHCQMDCCRPEQLVAAERLVLPYLASVMV
jgi:hypothetical protein